MIAYRDAGLPNIWGWGYDYVGLWGYKIFLSTSDGAFYCRPHNKTVPVTYWGGSGANYVSDAASLAIDASRCNDIYGRSDTVQPSAVTVNYYIKAR